MKTKFIILLCLLLTFLSYTNVYAQELEENQQSASLSARAVVIEVIDEKIGTESEELEDIYLFNERQIVTLKILSGKYKNDVITIENYLGGNEITDVRVEEGQRVILAIDEFSDGTYYANINSYERDIAIYALVIIFMVTLLLVGKLQGLKTIVTLSITILIVIFFTIPMILKGYEPILISVISCIVITVITLFFIAGISGKSFSAILGTAISVIISGLLAYAVGYFANLSGIEMTEGNMLLHIPQGIEFDFKALLFSGIIIGTLGASMDMCMSVTSSMYEIKKHNPDINSKDLFKSGLSVGKDVMGTMTNTLILAYTGSALPILLVFMAYNTPFMNIINLDIIATEIVRGVAGSAGVVLSVPITAYIVVLLNKIKQNKPVS